MGGGETGQRLGGILQRLGLTVQTWSLPNWGNISAGEPAVYSRLRRGLRLTGSSIQGFDRFRVMACYQGRLAHMLVSVALWSVLFLASGLSSLLTWCGHLLNLFCVG